MKMKLKSLLDTKIELKINKVLFNLLLNNFYKPEKCSQCSVK